MLNGKCQSNNSKPTFKIQHTTFKITKSVSKSINKVTSTAVPLDQENVDTDQIIPARFLKATSRDGFGRTSFVTGNTIAMDSRKKISYSITPSIMERSS